MFTMMDRVFRGTKINPTMQAVISFICCAALYFIGMGMITVLTHIPFKAIAYEPIYLGGMVFMAGMAACTVYDRTARIR